MQSILYWCVLIFGAIALAYIGPFNLAPLIFLAGGLLLGLWYAISLRIGRQHPGTTQTRLIGSILVYVMVFWTTTGMFSNVKKRREFWARYEPYVQGGAQQGYTFFYLDYAGRYERIDSPELNKWISERNPDRVRLVLEVVKDFGRLRAYTVRSVESIPVDKAWIDGNPPWEALRQP
jgi:hypothetical protein